MGECSVQKKEQGRRVVFLREGLIFLQQRNNRVFFSSLETEEMNVHQLRTCWQIR